jgi:hypothetical protein
MKNFIIFYLLLSSFTLLAIEKEDLPGSYANLDSIKFRKSLKANESMFYFNFPNLPKNLDLGIVYDYNGGPGKSVYLGKKRFFEVKVKPGIYYFQILLNNDYYEITTSMYTISSRNKAFVSCYFTRDYDINDNVVEKPVLYFYPTILTDLNVKLETKGELAFSYPAYENSWNFKADPTGNLTFGDKTYNYLFWESKQNLSAESIDYSQGFAIDRTSTIQFLEEKLNEFGLNNKEMADFITYWGPQLLKNERNYVHFVINEECNKFADLMITPRPDHVYRIYILTHALSIDSPLEFEAQEIKPIDRTGFTVIEWGGSILKQLEL